MSQLAVFKDKNNQWRWIAISSNPYRDRDGEIVSLKALKNDVARADKDKNYGTLRFWHTPAVLGHCDFNAMHGKTLVESGTFLNEQIARKVARNADNYQVSIGFRHPPTEPDKDGIYHNIKRFERSLVPDGRAANPFTSLTVKGDKMSTINETKLKALQTLLGDDDLVSTVLGQATAAEKQADAMGIAFKEVGDGETFADRLLDYAIAMKEAELEETEKAKKKPAKAMMEDDMEYEDDEEVEVSTKMEDYSSKMADYTTKMDDYMTKMGGYMKQMEKMFGKMEDEKTKEVKRVEYLAETIKQLQSELAQLQGEQPQITSGAGYRPSRNNDSIVTSKELQPEVQPNGQVSTAAGSLIDFVMPNHSNGVPGIQ